VYASLVRRSDERGFVSAQMAALVAIGFIFFLWFVNGLLLQYQHTAVEAALLDGARQGTRVASSDPDEVERGCQTAVNTTLASLLNGSAQRGEVRSVTCDFTPSSDGLAAKVSAKAEVKFKTLVPAPAGISPIPVEDTLTITVQRRTPGGGQ